MHQILPASSAVYCTSKILGLYPKMLFCLVTLQEVPQIFHNCKSCLHWLCLPWKLAYWVTKWFLNIMLTQYYAETLVCYWTEGRVPKTESPVLLSLAPGIFFGKFPTNYYAGQNLLTWWDLTRSQPEESQMVRHSHHHQHPQANELFSVQIYFQEDLMFDGYNYVKWAWIQD